MARTTRGTTKAEPKAEPEPKPEAKVAEPKPEAKVAETKPEAKVAETKPEAKVAEAKPEERVAESRVAEAKPEPRVAEPEPERSTSGTEETFAVRGERAYGVDEDSAWTEQRIVVDQPGPDTTLYDRTEAGPDGVSKSWGYRSEVEGHQVQGAEAGVSAGEDGLGAHAQVQQGPVTHRAEAGIDAEEGEAYGRVGTTVGDAHQISAVEARGAVDTDATDGGIGVRGSLHEEGAGGRVGSYVAGGVEHEVDGDGTSTTTAEASGRVVQGTTTVGGSARHEHTSSADGERTSTTTSVEGEVEQGDAGVRGRYERTTTTDGDTTADSTTIGGTVDTGDAAYSAERTVTEESTSSTRTSSQETSLGYEDDDGGSAGVHYGTREHVFDTDEEADVGDWLAGGRPEDHETTTTAGGHLGDTEASVRVTEGYDLDGTRGVDPLFGSGLGADYVEREWSSQEVQVGDHDVSHHERSETVVDNNPFDGDLENSSSYERGVSVDGVDASYSASHRSVTDLDPFDGEVGRDESFHRGVEVEGVEVAYDSSGRQTLDVGLDDGDVGAASSGRTGVTIGDGGASVGHRGEVSVGLGGADASAGVDASVSGVTSGTAGASAYADTDATDGEVGAGGGVAASGQVFGQRVGASSHSSVSAGEDGLDAAHETEVMGLEAGGSASVDGDGAEASGSFLGVTVTGAIGAGGVRVGVETEHPESGAPAQTPGETVDEILGGVGDAAGDALDGMGDVAEDIGDGIGDALEGAGDAVDDFFGGDDDDDDDDDGDGTSIGDVIDNFLGGFG